MLEKIEISDEGEWMATQMRLLTAGFRTHDKVTLETTYNNMAKRFGEKFASDVLFEIYMENQQRNPNFDPANS